MDPQVGDDLLAFLDELAGWLQSLLGNLPKPGEEATEEQAEVAIGWWAKVRTAVIQKEFKKYTDPEHVAGTVVPVGVIPGCTGLGALLGGAIGAGAGGGVGRMIVGQIKPDKAAEDILDAGN